ncbi:MAG: tetratricopeptide repeat protein [Gemmatimonadetes bacterium]|nr:tetratricopeptide repeat protein [Gemmatimonadota bacterium]
MSDSPSRFRLFLAELKRRRVYRVTCVYAIVGWLIVQVVNAVFPNLHLPPWTATFVVVLVLLGFPIALVLAWAFEITPEGVRRTEPLSPEAAALAVRRGVPVPWSVMLAGMVMMSIAVLGVLNVGGWRQRLFGPGEIKSLAVLPLENHSPDPAQEYFSDGMTEALITELSRISALRVVSRTSVMQYKGTPKSMRTIADELDVDAVVEGSVLREGERVRITAQLIHARADRHLWAEEYVRDLQDILGLQREVARTIANEIQVKLTPVDRARFAATARPVNPEAYDAYLKGRYHWNKRTKQDLLTAARYFFQAIEKDPNSALGYAGLADCMMMCGWHGFMEHRMAFAQGKGAALKALDIDSTVAEAHTSLAYAAFYLDWDWAAAEREFRRAIELNPHYPGAHHWYADFLSAMGRHEEAIPEAVRARELDPLSSSVGSAVGWALYLGRRYDEAIEEYRKIVGAHPNFVPGHFFLGLAYEARGLFPQAIGEFQMAISLSDSSVAYLAALAHTYAVAGDRARAASLLEQMKRLSTQHYVSGYWIAEIHAALGEIDEAFEWLERASEEPSSWMVYLRVDPRLDPLRSDPRFDALLEKVGLRKVIAQPKAA